jgi:tripartite-type tricarboxylate transporter receptor subunit TctC
MKSGKCNSGLSAASFLAALFISLSFLPGDLLGQTPFYQGKTITFIAGTEPGGTLDMRIKSILPFLRKHVPGEPTIVTEYMPGGGGRKAANYIYKVARPDGLTISSPVGGFVMLAVLKEQGVEYDINKLIYLGAPDGVAHYVFHSRTEARLSTIERLRETQGVRIGAQSVGHTIYVVGRLFAYVLGLKEPRFVTGYSGPELDLALVRGEIDARPNLAETILRRNPEFLEKGLVDFHAILEAPLGNKHPRFSHLPEIGSFARNQKASGLLEMFRGSRTAGGPYILPPGSPKERVEILREAVRRAFKDPDYQKLYKKLVGDDSAPVTGEEVEKTIKRLPRDPETIELYKKLVGPGPLPPH